MNTKPTHPTFERLRQAMLALDIEDCGPTGVARFLNLASPQTAKNWEERGISFEGMVTASSRGVNPAWLANGQEPMLISKATPHVEPHGSATTVPVPLLAGAASMGGGEDVTEGDVIAGYMPVTQEWLHQRRITQVDALRLVQGRGSSMEPTFKDGDLLLVNTAQRDAERVPGVYVLRADGQLFVKRVQHGMNGAAFVSSDNPAIKLVEPLQGGYPIDVIGRVLWVWKREEIR